MNNNPNATLAAGSTGVGVLLIYLLSVFGVTMPAEVAVAAAGALTSALLYIGRKGLKGALCTLWRGNNPTN